MTYLSLRIIVVTFKNYSGKTPDRADSRSSSYVMCIACVFRFCLVYVLFIVQFRIVFNLSLFLLLISSFLHLLNVCVDVRCMYDFVIVYLSSSLSLYLSLSFSLSFSFSLTISLYLSLSLSLSLHLSLSLYLYLSLYFYLSLSLSVYLYLYFYFSIYLSLYLFLSSYLSICLSIVLYLSLYIFM